MVDFRLSEEQEALRASVREFAREQVAPVIAEHYERKTFPYDLVRQIHPRLIHAAFATPLGWRAFQAFCQGDLSMARVLRRPSIHLAVNLLGGRA